LALVSGIKSGEVAARCVEIDMTENTWKVNETPATKGIVEIGGLLTNLQGPPTGCITDGELQAQLENVESQIANAKMQEPENALLLMEMQGAKRVLQHLRGIVMNRDLKQGSLPDALAKRNQLPPCINGETPKAETSEAE